MRPARRPNRNRVGIISEEYDEDEFCRNTPAIENSRILGSTSDAVSYSSRIKCDGTLNEMLQRLQQTISKVGEVQGIGFRSGVDVTLRFLPAPPDQGIVFVRTDAAEPIPIPAAVELTVPGMWRTAIESRDHPGNGVEITEHVLAALAGLLIDNCIVELDGPEPPGCDGSSGPFAECLLDAGIVDQGVPGRVLRVDHEVCVSSDEGRRRITATSNASHTLSIHYQLDCGPDSPIPPQSFAIELTPESFMQEIAYCRTFLSEEWANQLRAQGFGRRATARELLVFGAHGPIDNRLRMPDECARHKILDILGDLALIGCDVIGHFEAVRSGHQHNTELARRLMQEHADSFADGADPS